MKKLIGLGVTICLLAGSACFGMTATNGLQLDITWPWPIKLELSWPSNFTHAVDVYYCDDLRTAQWQYLMAGEATTGLEALVITDLDSTNRPMGFYAPGDADFDTDGDLLADDRERYIYKTNPTLPDSDGDGLNDGFEVQNGFNPLSSPGQSEADVDTDGDGLSDPLEYLFFGDLSQTSNTDFDGDGLLNGEEFGSVTLGAPVVIESAWVGHSTGMNVISWGG